MNLKNKLIPPFHQGDGINGSYFNLFMSESVYPGDIIYNQRTDMRVSGVTHIDEDFMEDYYIVKVRLMLQGPEPYFEMRDLSDTEVFRLYSTTTN